MLQVRNRPVVYPRRDAGASVYFGHISSYIKKMEIEFWSLCRYRCKKIYLTKARAIFQRYLNSIFTVLIPHFEG